jgi:hypothetical protein
MTTKSPCSECLFVRQSKNRQPCDTCTDPTEFADAVWDDCAIRAIDYTDPLVIAESHLRSFAGSEITII